MTDLSKPAAESGHLHRSVGLTSLMFISLGSIIGSGWLLGALTAAKAAGGASLISWLLSLSGHDVDAIDLPPHGRAPGWTAGLTAASRHGREAARTRCTT